MALCWPVQLAPTHKAVLVSLADQSNDHGYCWPSIAGISERTCFGRTAVIDALAWLEQAGFVTVEKHHGRNNRYQMNLESIAGYSMKVVRETDQSAKRTSPADGLTGTAGGLPPVRQADQPVRQADPNRKEPSVEPSITKVKAPKVACPEDVSEQTWTDWTGLRKQKRANVSITVVNEARNEACKAGLTLERFLVVWCLRGSQGLLAEWLTPAEKNAPPVEGNYARSMRLKYEQITPTIAAKAPGTPINTTFEVLDAEPVTRRLG